VQLTTYTDYSLRTLMALAVVAPEKLTVGEISQAYGISQHHLLKVVQQLSGLGYLETTRGKSGGVRLARPPQQIRIGTLVRQVEPELGLVSCLRSGDEPCVLAPMCRLSRLLREATEHFLAELDQHTLGDLIQPKTQILSLLQLM
jgi:Rrf2 family nitric oxide-sensitive transcriptional repressor